MSEPETKEFEEFREKVKTTVKAARKRFELILQTDEQLSAGTWETLPCGLEVRIAPPSTQEFFRVSAAMLRKFGKGKAKVISDLPPDKQTAWSYNTLALAVFLGFRDPETGEPSVLINGEEIEDSVESRKWILANLPTIRRQIDDKVGDVAAAFEAETEDAGKNL